MSPGSSVKIKRSPTLYLPRVIPTRALDSASLRSVNSVIGRILARTCEQKDGPVSMPENDLSERVHALEVGAATQAGAQATQAAVQAGAQATTAAAHAGTLGVVGAGGVALIVGIFLGIAIRSGR